MAKYILLVSWTDQGIKAVKDSPARVDKVREIAKSLGASMDQLYLVMGEYDVVTVVDAPDDVAMAKLALKIAMGGNTRTRTLKAFGEDEFRKIVAAL